jgi:hypothetical protein
MRLPPWSRTFLPTAICTPGHRSTGRWSSRCPGSGLLPAWHGFCTIRTHVVETRLGGTPLRSWAGLNAIHSRSASAGTWMNPLIERWRSRRQWGQRVFYCYRATIGAKREPAPSHPSFLKMEKQSTAVPVLLSGQNCTLYGSYPHESSSSNHDRGCDRRDAWVGPSS